MAENIFDASVWIDRACYLFSSLYFFESLTVLNLSTLKSLTGTLQTKFKMLIWCPEFAEQNLNWFLCYFCLYKNRTAFGNNISDTLNRSKALSDIPLVKVKEITGFHIHLLHAHRVFLLVWAENARRAIRDWVELAFVTLWRISLNAWSHMIAYTVSDDTKKKNEANVFCSHNSTHN